LCSYQAFFWSEVVTIYFATPSMQHNSPGMFKVGTLVSGVFPNSVAIQLPDGTYQSVLHTGQDANSKHLGDQETFYRVIGNDNVLIGDRSSYSEKGGVLVQLVQPLR
jgi:hypothetical protein